jgi:hypothetical protein
MLKNDRNWLSTTPKNGVDNVGKICGVHQHEIATTTHPIGGWGEVEMGYRHGFRPSPPWKSGLEWFNLMKGRSPVNSSLENRPIHRGEPCRV